MTYHTILWRKSRKLHFRIARQYELIAWIISIFVGGSINSIALKIFVIYYWENYGHLHPTIIQLVNYIPDLILPVSILFAIPILLSLALTKIVSESEKQIVPPLYLQIIAVTLFFLFGYYFGEIAVNLQMFLVFIGYIALVGETQDRIVKWSVGLSGHEDYLFAFSLKAKADLEAVKEIIMIEPIRNTLGLVDGFEKTNRGLIFRTRKSDRNQIVIELQEKKGEHSETFVNMVAFERRRYSIKSSEQLEEYAKSKIAYLKDVFSRSEYSIELKEVPDYSIRSLRNYIVDEEMAGISSRMTGISRLGWLKTSAFIFGMIIVIGLLFYQERPEALALLAMFLLYVATDLPSRLLSRRR